MKLYDISERYKNLIQLMEDGEVPEDILKESLNSVEEEFEEKANNIAKLVKTEKAEVAVLKEEIKRLTNRAKAKENNSKNLQKYLEENMIMAGKEKFKTTLFSFNIQANAKSLKIIDENLIPEKYKFTEVNYLKDAIKNDIKNGLEVPGVNLVQTRSLRIR